MVLLLLTPRPDLFLKKKRKEKVMIPEKLENIEDQKVNFKQFLVVYNYMDLFKCESIVI